MDMDTLFNRIADLEGELETVQKQLEASQSRVKALEHELEEARRSSQPKSEEDGKATRKKLHWVQLRFDREQFDKLAIAWSLTALNPSQAPRGKSGLANRSLTKREFFRRLLSDAEKQLDQGTLTLPMEGGQFSLLPSLPHPETHHYYAWPAEEGEVRILDRIIETLKPPYGRADLTRQLVFLAHDRLRAPLPPGDAKISGSPEPGKAE